MLCNTLCCIGNVSKTVHNNSQAGVSVLFPQSPGRIVAEQNCCKISLRMLIVFQPESCVVNEGVRFYPTLERDWLMLFYQADEKLLQIRSIL